MIKMIMSDMDGTLLDENGQLPQEFDEVMELLREKNILFAPASGRQYYALLHQFEKYKDDFVFFAENGTYVSYREIELFSSSMPTTAVEQLMKTVDSLEDIYPVLCGKKSAYVNSKYRPFLEEMEKYYTQYTFVEDFSLVDDDIIKLSLCDCDRQDAERTIYPAFDAYEGKLQVAVSSNFWVDIMNYGINKGVAIQQVQKMLGISPLECAAFGDYLNDMEMMSAVHYSYAMENAHPRVKEAANFQAKSNREHGVMLAIKDLVSQQL
jgi:Cof subfamily protein (haloacid dehalogenase superfamily)